MRTVLLLSLSLVLGFGAFAQNRVAKSDLKSFQANKTMKVAVGNETTNPTVNYAPKTAKSVVVNRYNFLEDGETMWSYYDLQSNGWISNRMYQLPDGSVAVAATMSHEENSNGGADRGTGYNFYREGAWNDQPEERVEEMRTGWPSIAQWGERGEILISHAPMRCWTREVAGEGEWQYRGELPIHPEDFPYTDDASWPRIATSGDNHNIVHVLGDIQSQDAEGSYHHYQVYLRSEDAENWTIDYSPLAQDGEELDLYTADCYNISANGHNVAMIYSGDLQSHVVMYKSTDDGLTWKRRVVWENPYYGCDWSNDSCSLYNDTLYGPSDVAIAVGKDGVAHVAISTYAWIHTALGTGYSVWSGEQAEGIAYWNDSQDGPIADTRHEEYVGTPMEEHLAYPNPHHALRLWWPVPNNPGYVHMIADSTKWIGFVPQYEGYDFDHDHFFNDDDYASKIMYSTSAWPALSIDPMGNIACAYSSPNTTRSDVNTENYLRSIYVSYRNVDNGYWDQLVDELTDADVFLPFLVSENIFTNAVDNTANVGEYWFSFQSDNQIGCYVGNYAAQNEGTENTIHVVKVIPEEEYYAVPENQTQEAKDVIYGIYPNPATDYVVVKSAQDVEANISIANLVGQTVKQFNKSLKMGENTISIDLKSGIYFCTINANGFNKTIKFVVK